MATTGRATKRKPTLWELRGFLTWKKIADRQFEEIRPCLRLLNPKAEALKTWESKLKACEMAYADLQKRCETLGPSLAERLCLSISAIREPLARLISYADGEPASNFGIRADLTAVHDAEVNAKPKMQHAAIHVGHELGKIEPIAPEPIGAKQQQRTDSKTDRRKKVLGHTPRNDAVSRLAYKLRREYKHGENTKLEIAMKFTGNNRKKAESLLRQLRSDRYKNLLDGADT
jgi:hypothetical protein